MSICRAKWENALRSGNLSALIKRHSSSCRIRTHNLPREAGRALDHKGKFSSDRASDGHWTRCAFQPGCVATASTVGAMTCGYLNDEACVGKPTDARMKVPGDSHEFTFVVGGTPPLTFIPPMRWPPCSTIVAIWSTSALRRTSREYRAESRPTKLARDSSESKCTVGLSIPTMATQFSLRPRHSSTDTARFLAAQNPRPG